MDYSKCSAVPGGETADVGRLLCDIQRSDKLVVALLLIGGLILGLMTMGALKNLADAKGIAVAMLMAIAACGSLGAAAYRLLSNVHWQCYERGIVELSRWGARLILYDDVEQLCYSIGRNFTDGKYGNTWQRLDIKPKRGGKSIRLLYFYDEQIIEATDALVPSEIDEVRDLISARLSERMQSQMEQGKVVSLTPRLAIHRQGLHIMDKSGATRDTRWGEIAGAGIAEGTFHIWLRGQAKPVISVPMAAPNLFPGYQLLMQRLCVEATPSAIPDDDGSEADKSKCPACGIDTDSLKRYEFPQVGFLLLHFSVGKERVTRCPRCMRRYLTTWGLVSLLGTNVLWPFVVLPLLITRFPATFRVGDNLAEKSFGKKLLADLAHIGMLGSAVLGSFTILCLLFGDFPSYQLLLSVAAGAIAGLVMFGAIGIFVDV